MLRGSIRLETWFEPNPDEQDQVHWVEEELPIACGKHKLGITDTTEDCLMLSHLIVCEKIGCCTYKVYPRKGESWALFKNWDIKLCVSVSLSLCVCVFVCVCVCVCVCVSLCLYVFCLTRGEQVTDAQDFGW